jgi:hypothetical protein
MTEPINVGSPIIVTPEQADVLEALKPRTLVIQMTSKEETDLRVYLESTTQEDKENGFNTPPVVSDLLEGLIQAEGGKTIDYKGGTAGV